MVLRALPALLILVTLFPTGSGQEQPGPLSPVQDLEVRSVGGVNLVTWNSPASDGGSPIASYQVARWDPTEIHPWVPIASLGSEANSYSDSAPDTSKAATGYRVTAVNEAGASASDSVYTFVSSSLVGGNGCYFLESRTNPPGAQFNGTCLIITATGPAPILRDPLLAWWANILNILREVWPHGVTTSDGGGVK